MWYAKDLNKWGRHFCWKCSEFDDSYWCCSWWCSRSFCHCHSAVVYYVCALGIWSIICFLGWYEDRNEKENFERTHNNDRKKGTNTRTRTLVSNEIQPCIRTYHQRWNAQTFFFSALALVQARRFRERSVSMFVCVCVWVYVRCIFQSRARFQWLCYYYMLYVLCTFWTVKMSHSWSLT